MAKVLLKSTRTGGTKKIDARVAEVLVKRGGWEYAEAPAAEAAPAAASVSLADMSFNDLRALAKERGVEAPRGTTKAELLERLQTPARGTYQRRDMRATEE